MAEWAFRLDENIDPKAATYLAKEALDATHVRDTLGQGADDEADVLPSAREHNRIIVTSDVREFDSLPPYSHAGIVILYDDTMPADRVAPARIALGDAADREHEPSTVGADRRDATTRRQHRRPRS
jgi:hypothetical protein